MSIIRLKVLQTFPVWRRKKDMQLGEVFAVEWTDCREIGGAFFFPDSPKDSAPDFSGKRLAYLTKHKFIGNPE